MGNRRFGNPGSVGDCCGMLGLVDQVEREQRRGVFLEPLIERGSNLFAEIGGMPEKNLRGPAQREYESFIDIIVLFCQIGLLVQALWKTVKKQENVMDRCSACAGELRRPGTIRTGGCLRK